LHLPPILATVLCIVGIAGLFRLDRDPEPRVSKALWIPTAYLLLVGSRPFSMWLGLTPGGQQSDIYLEGSPIDAAVILALLIAGLIVLVGRAERVQQVLKQDWPILLFFAYAALSILWSDYPLVTFKHWIKGIGDVAMILIVLTESDLTDAVKRLVTRVSFTLLPLSILLGKYYPGIGRHVNRSWEMEFTGVATQKNSLGTICWIFGLVLLWRFRAAYNDGQDPSRRRRLVALGTVFGMVIWLLWKCNSLTSICALSMAGAVMLLSGRPAFRRSPLLVHLLVAALLGTAAFALFFQTSRTLVQDLGRDPSMSGRTQIWAAVLSPPVNRLVGAGYESFWLGRRLEEVHNFPGVPDDLNESHNGYIEMYINLGWVGVIMLAVLIVWGYRNVVGAYRRDPNAGSGSLRFAILLGAVVAGFTEAAFRLMGPTWIFFLLATSAVPANSAPDGDGQDGSAQYWPEPGQEPDADIYEEALKS
jgi:exopolysaccharide production protein ExoQ